MRIATASATSLALLSCLVLPSPARADDAPTGDDTTGQPSGPPKNFDEMQDNDELTCVGSPDVKLAAPQEYDVGGFHYTLLGGRATVARKTARTHPDIRLGILNAIKDRTPETLANLSEYLAKFHAADVDAILVGGDTAYDEDDVESILETLAASGLPIYAVIGNAETKAGFNRAVHAAWQKAQNVLNGDLIRVYNGDGFHVVSLPGYYDKHFASSVAPCLYTQDDVDALGPILASTPAPTVFLTHGPPRQEGKMALDYTQQAGNVGDPALTDALAKAKVAFGIFGHIVEAGGHATDATGKREIRPATFSDTLYLNPGSANSEPWRMNSPPETSWGLAAIMTLENGKAKYEILRSPQRVGK